MLARGFSLSLLMAALIFPLATSKQLRRALTIRYRDSSVDSNIPGTSLDQGVSSHFKILSAEIEIEPTYPQSLFASTSQSSSRSLLKGRARLLSPASDPLRLESNHCWIRSRIIV